MRAFVLAMVVLFSSLVAAHAERRVALIIGNAAYEQVPRLGNPAKDAGAVADAFRRLGFDEVVVKADLDYAGFRRAMIDFGRIAEGADIAVLYYAGHGIEIDGRNYLIPVDAKLQDARDADFEAMPLDLAMATLERVREVRVVILDACRDNPFSSRMRSAGGTRSIGRGLARVDTPGNTLVAYAAKEGTTADDGEDEHSPFTMALLEQIESPGLEVRLMFGRVRDAVLKRTSNRQEPFVYGAVGGREIYLKPAQAEPVSAAPTPAAPQTPLSVVTQPQSDREALFWSSVKDSSNPAVLQAYLDQYPDGTFSGLAKVLIERLKADAARESEKQAAPRSAALTAPEAPDAERPVMPSEMIALGVKYETGEGRQKDAARAAEWYREAARSGDPEAKYRLGLLYYRGEGVGQSFTEAAVQILDAVRVNFAPAIDGLGTAGLSEPEFLKVVQQRLNVLGYYRGAVDGNWGSESRNAVLVLSGRKTDPARDNAQRPTRMDRRTAEKPVQKAKTASGGSAETPVKKKTCAKMHSDPAYAICW